MVGAEDGERRPFLDPRDPQFRDDLDREFIFHYLSAAKGNR